MDTLIIELINKQDKYTQLTELVDVLIKLKAPNSDAEIRTAINLMLSVDISGSMAPVMELLRKTLTFIIGQLNDDDTLGIVTFSFHMDVLIPMTRMTGANKALATKAVSTLNANGGTNLSGGLFKAITEMMTYLIKPDGRAAVSSIFLLTDGEATDGIVDLHAIVKVLQDRSFDENMIEYEAPRRLGFRHMQAPPAPTLKPRVAQTGVPKYEGELPIIHTFGFGPNYNAELLKGIAEAGNGTNVFIPDESKLAESFGNALGGLTHTTAKDIVCTLTASPAFQIERLRGGHANGFAYTFKEMQSGETRDVIATLRVTEHGQLQPVFSLPLLTAKVVYHNMLHGNAVDEISATCSVKFVSAENMHLNAAIISDEFVLQSTRIDVAEALHEALQLAANDNAAARARLYECTLQLQRTNSDSVRATSMGADLEQVMAALNNDINFATKTMSSLSCEHFNQRSSAIGRTYSTPAQTVMAAAAQTDMERSSSSSSSGNI